jgi:hypothetical protein
VIRIATVADTRFRQRAANLLRSLENSPNDFHLTVYCDDEAAFCGLRGLRCDVVELTEIKRLGAKRAKLTAFAEALRGGSVIYLDADAIVLENLDELWGGDRIKGVLDDLEEQRDYLTFIQDPKRPWPEDPSLLNRCYIASCAFYAPIGLFPLFEEMRLASLDDTTWRRYIAEGFLYDQQFLNAFLNKNEAPIELLDPTVYGWDGLLSRGAVQVYRSGRRLLNKHTHRTLRLALFAGPQQTPELLRSLPIEVASLIFERIAPDKPTWEGAMAQLYAALSDPLGKRSREPFVKDILKLMITEIPHLAANYASPDLANQPSYFANPDLIRSAAFANPLPQCTWNGLFCGGANLDPEEYCQVRTLVRRLNIRQVLEAGAGETSILFQALGAKTYSLEYQRGPWVDRATASGATCLLVPFDEERRRFSEPELRDRLAELGLSAVDLLFIDSPVGARNRHNVPSQLLEQVKPRFVLYHDSLRDSANLLQDQVRHDLKLIYFLDSPRGLALFALPPHETSGWLTDSFDAATVVSEGRVILAFLEPRAAVLQAGERSCVRIGLTNTTEDTLSSRYTQPIHLAYHWLAMDGTTVVWDGVRTGLPCDLDPGDTVECLLTVVAPEQEGIYRLQAAIVQEGVSWFEIAEPDSAAEAVVCVEAPPRRRGIRDSGWPGQERIHLRGRNADGSTLPGACFIRNPDLVEQPGIENGFSIPLRPRFMQLSSFAAGILDHFGDEPASLDETSADTTPAVREAVDALVELGALLRTEARCLITGCGRSGTKYIAHLLSAAGLDIGHETMGKDGIASWLMAVDSAYADRGPLRRHFRFRTILHQTRDPLASISSMQTMQLPSWRYICRHIPCSLEEPLLLRCAKYWRYWNLEAESIATWRYRVEDVACVWGELCERLEIAADRTVLSAVPQTTNTRQGNYQRLAWDDIASVDENLCTSIKEQAARYGYAVKN